MYPLFRNIEPLQLPRMSEPIFGYNPMKMYKQTTPRHNTNQHIMIMGKPLKNGMNLVHQGSSRSSQGSNNSQKLIPSAQQVQLSQILPTIKQLQLRVISLSEAVLHHQQILSQSTNGKFSTDSSDSMRNMSKMIHQQFQKQNMDLFSRSKQFLHKSPSSPHIMSQITQLKSQLSKQFKQKSLLDRKYFSELLKKQTQSQIMNMYQANRQVFRRIEIDMNELRQLIQSTKKTITSESKSPYSFFSSNKKFVDPKIIRYRETIEINTPRPSSSSFEKHVQITQPVILSQTLFYLDKDNYLLDSQCYYLVDENGNNLKLEKSHIQLLRTHNLLA